MNATLTRRIAQTCFLDPVGFLARPVATTASHGFQDRCCACMSAFACALSAKTPLPNPLIYPGRFEERAFAVIL